MYFYRLKFNRSGQICIAGFCEPSDAEPDDIALWLPHRSSKKRTITSADVRTAKYIVANVGDEFCKLVEQEQECVIWSGKATLFFSPPVSVSVSWNLEQADKKLRKHLIKVVRLLHA